MSTATASRTAVGHPSPLWHAMVALGEHMHKHELPDFGQVDVDEHQLIVHLAGAGAEVWQESIAVDTIDTDDSIAGGFREWVLVAGRLPDTGVRVVLSWPRSKRQATRLTEPVPISNTVADLLGRLDPTQVATCQECGTELDVTHGAERGQTLCSSCCWADKRTGSHGPCCEEGARP